MKNRRIGQGMKPRGMANSEPQMTQEPSLAEDLGEVAAEQVEGRIDEVEVSADEVQPEGAIEAPGGPEEGESGGGTLEPEKVQNLETDVAVDATGIEALLQSSKGPKPAENDLNPQPKIGNAVSTKIQDGRNDDEWLKKRAEEEDGSLISVGGLVSDIEAAEKIPFPVFSLGPEGETAYQTYHRGFKDGWNSPSAQRRLAELICQYNGYVGERADGSYGVVVTIGEGYIGAVREWAEADGLDIETWLSNLVTANIETYGQPAKGR